MAAQQFFPEVLLIGQGANFPPYGTGAKVDVEPARDASGAQGRTAYLRSDLMLKTTEARVNGEDPEIATLREQVVGLAAQRDHLQTELQSAHAMLAKAEQAMSKKTPAK